MAKEPRKPVRPKRPAKPPAKASGRECGVEAHAKRIMVLTARKAQEIGKRPAITRKERKARPGEVKQEVKRLITLEIARSAAIIAAMEFGFNEEAARKLGEHGYNFCKARMEGKKIDESHYAKRIENYFEGGGSAGMEKVERFLELTNKINTLLGKKLKELV